MKVNKAFQSLFTDKNRFNIVYGGAGSSKSYSTAQKIIVKCIEEPGHKWLVIRKVARTIRYSVWSLITSLIQAEDGLAGAFRINKTDFKITCLNGNEILFLGLDDVEKLKSIHGITGIWIEEASEISEDDFKQCNLRLRGRTTVQKQIILTFNPISHLHWLKKYFFDNKQDNCTIHKSTYLDNAFIDEEYKRELEKLKHQDKTFYQIYALGDWGIIGNLVFSNYVIEDWDYPEVEYTDYDSGSKRMRKLAPEEYYDDVYQGADFGFNHPSALIKVGFKDGELWIYDEVYKRELTNTELIGEAGQFFDKHFVVTGDSAEPARIMEFRKSGFNCRAAQKGPESVRHGIDFLRRYKIHIHKRLCNNTANEFQLYKYKEDKDGNILDEPVNFHDDAIAALRYAIEPFRLQRKMTVPEIGAGALGL